MSKGSTQRPIEDRDSYERNWDAIFGKKSQDPKEEKNEHGKEHSIA